MKVKIKLGSLFTTAVAEPLNQRHWIHPSVLHSWTASRDILNSFTWDTKSLPNLKRSTVSSDLKVEKESWVSFPACQNPDALDWWLRPDHSTSNPNPKCCFFDYLRMRFNNQLSFCISYFIHRDPHCRFWQKKVPWSAQLCPSNKVFFAIVALFSFKKLWLLASVQTLKSAHSTE